MSSRREKKRFRRFSAASFHHENSTASLKFVTRLLPGFLDTNQLKELYAGRRAMPLTSPELEQFIYCVQMGPDY